MLSLPSEFKSRLKSDLVNDEGCKLMPYTDSRGVLSIGIGRAIGKIGITQEEALFLLDDDILRTEKDLWHYWPSYANLDNVRKLTCIQMAFNLGIEGFLNFKLMIGAIEAKNYEEAARQMISSDWAKEVGKRSIRLAAMMETGSL